MRTSGRGGSDAFLFIAPAAIFGGFFLWLFGGAGELLNALDGSLVRAGRAALEWMSALLS